MSKPKHPTAQRWLRWSGPLLTILLFSAIVISRANAGAALFDIEAVAFGKTFTPVLIGPGSTTALNFTIENPDPVTLTNLAFTDTLPAGVYIATPANIIADCGVDYTLATPDDSTIIFNLDELAEFSTCAVSIDVTSIVTGTHTNTTEDLISDSGNHGPATTYLIVDEDQPGFRKSFTPNTVPLGGRSTLVFTIDNTLNSSAVTNLDFVDNLPAGLVVADPANASTDCVSPNPLLVATITATPGTSVIILDANGTTFGGNEVLPAGATCTVAVDTVATGAGMLDNVTENLLADFVSSGKASATLDVTVTPIALIKDFVDDPTPPGGTVTLQFTIKSFDRTYSATAIAFTDDLTTLVPALPGLTFDSLLSNDCGGSVSGAGGDTISFTGGTLGAGGECTISVSLSVPAGATPGAYANSTSAVSGTIDGSPVVGNVASDVLFVEPVPLLTIEFLETGTLAPDPVINPGDDVVMRFTITNQSATSGAANITFDDELTDGGPGTGFLPFPVTVALPPVPNPPCGAGSSLALDSFDTDHHRLSLTDGSLDPSPGAGSSCTFSVTVTAPDDLPPGIYLDTTEEIFATVDGATHMGRPASDTLTVIAAPSLTKEFTDDPVAPGGTVTLEFTLAYPPDASDDATDITFTDNLLLMSITGLTATLPSTPDPPCGEGSLLAGSAGDTLLTLQGGSLSPGASCTFSMTLDVPIGTAPGTYGNTTSSVGATVLDLPATSLPARDDLKVTGLVFTKEFLGDPVIAGDTVTLRFTIENIHPTDEATSVTFTDNLAANLASLAATGGASVDTCNGALSGTTSLTYIGGSVSSGQTCTIEVTVLVPVSAADGSYSNVTSNLTAVQGGPVTIDPAVDDLVVNSNLMQLTKEFTDDPVAPGDPVTLEFNLTNLDAGQAASDIGFTDDLGAALTDLTFDSVLANDCGGTVSGETTTMVTVSGASLVAGGACTLRVSLTVPAAAEANIYTNNSSDVSGMIGGFAVTGDAASDNLEVIQLLLFSKSFDGPSTATGAATLTFVITNPGSDTASGISFSDNLDDVISGLVTTNLPLGNVCGAGSIVSGVSFLTLTGASLPPMGGTCSFDIELLVPATATAGTFPNITGDLGQNGLKVSDPATADLIIEPPPAFSKSFAPDTMFAGQVSTLTFTIDNTASALAASSLDFGDTLPAGVIIATPPNTSTTCTGGTITAVAGTDSVSYSGGTVDAGASCTVQANVTSIVSGTHANTTGDLTSSSGNSGPASDTLTVNPLADLAIGKSDSPDPVVAGKALSYTLVVTNYGPSAATGILVTDTLPTEFTPTGNTCGASGAPLVWDVGSVPATNYDACTIYGTVDAVVSGTVTNTATVASDITDLQPDNNTVTETTTVHGLTSIGDYVWYDMSMDGIQDGGEMGVPNVTVNLRDGANTTQLAITTTNASGFYSFTNLVPGDYLLEFVPLPGFVFTLQDQGADDADSDADPATGQTVATTLAPGEDDFSWDAGMYELASTGDRVWYDTNQDGIQDGGEMGVPGVTVNLRDGANITQLYTTTTDASGLYSFTNLSPGDYLIEFVLPLDFVFTLQDQSDDDADSDADPATGQTISTTLDPGENDFSWDAGMYEPISIGDHVWYDVNQDGIQDGSEMGVPDVTVNLRDGDNTTQLDTTTTNATGFYSFTNLLPGDYLVEFILPPDFVFVPQDQGADDTDSDANPATGQTISTTLTPGETDFNWDAGMFVPPASIGDYVWYDTNQDGIQDGGEMGVPDMVVNLRDGANTTQLYTTTTDASGFYSFTNLVPGDYLLEFALPPNFVFTLQDQGADDADSDADPATGQTISTTLAPDENDFSWDAGMYEPISIGDYVWYDANQDGIQDSGEMGVPDVTVNLHDVVGTAQIYTATTTNATGFYSFTNLLPGDYLVEFVLPPDFIFTLQNQGADDTADSDADPATGQTISTTLDPGETDFGWDAGMFVPPAFIGDYVWYDANQDGIQDDGEMGVPNVVVNLRNGINTTQLYTTTTDATGFYSFTDLLPGDYLVEFVLPAGLVFTLQDQGVDDAADSDADPSTGQTISTTLDPGESDLTWDAGLFEFSAFAYLPLMMRNYARPVIAPDLVVEEIIATGDSVQVVIGNQGNAPVEAGDGFWVQVYIDPSPAPTAVNQLWYDLGDEGMLWVVDDDLLPLNPGVTLTLTYSDTYYWPTHSRFYENLAPGTPVYAQVDAWGDASTGGVLENHEILGEAYNNISMTTSADRSGRDHAAIPTYSLRPWLENMLP